jgi:HEPN domain-containing protein
MRNPDHVNAVVAEWVLKAENDLKNAAHTLKLRGDCPTDTVCFHAQQCAEKYLKALLVFCDVSFPKTHDIESLVDRLAPGRAVNVSPQEQGRLSSYAVALRYPESPAPSLAEARKAVAIARRVRRDVRRLLPRATLRRRKK